MSNPADDTATTGAGRAVDEALTDQPPEREHPYREECGRLIYEKPTRYGPVYVRLCNFTARIVAETVDADQRRWLEMVAWLKGRTISFEIPAAQFASVRWVGEQLGVKAIVEPGRSTRAHLRAAIQHLSEPAT